MGRARAARPPGRTIPHDDSDSGADPVASGDAYSYCPDTDGAFSDASYQHAASDLYTRALAHFCPDRAD